MDIAWSRECVEYALFSPTSRTVTLRVMEGPSEEVRLIGGGTYRSSVKGQDEPKGCFVKNKPPAITGGTNRFFYLSRAHILGHLPGALKVGGGFVVIAADKA